MKVMFTCNTAADYLGSAALPKAKTSDGTSYFVSGYVDIFKKTLQSQGQASGVEFEILEFIPRKYDLLSEQGIEFAKKEFIEMAEKADMIFHDFTLFKDEIELTVFGNLDQQTPAEKEAKNALFQGLSEMESFATRLLNDTPHLRAKSDVVGDGQTPCRTTPVTDKRFAIQICEENGIPTPRHFTMDEMRLKLQRSETIPLPLVFKDVKANNGLGVFFIETLDQLSIIFNPEKIALAKEIYPHINMDKLDFTFEEFIESPGDYWTKYRVVFNGYGAKHLNSVMSYSENQKSCNVIINHELHEDARIFHDFNSPLYLKSVQKQADNELIALYPLTKPKSINSIEAKVLSDHGIDPANPAVPPKLLAQAEHLTRLLSERGMIGMQGHDWMKGVDGNFYLIEVNTTPSCRSFLTAMNGGKGLTFRDGFPAKATAAAKAIIATFKERAV